MQALRQDEDLTPHIGARLRINKPGMDGKDCVYEGLLKGRSPVAVIASAPSHATVHGLLDSDGTDIHFVYPGDGWGVHRL